MRHDDFSVSYTYQLERSNKTDKNATLKTKYITAKPYAFLLRLSRALR